MNFIPSSAGLALSLVCSSGDAAELSPAAWPAEERAHVEALELAAPWPREGRVVEGKSVLVAATLSPIAIRAGIEALKQGGTAADAAATVALTQVATALGSYVSYAGTLQLVYYEARTAKVHSLNALWGTYREETDPNSIPKSDHLETGQGRKTLVPGFMAGIEAMHRRFGTLPFADVFEPAIWYSENGLNVSPLLAGYFASRQKYLLRTAEGKAFAHPVEGRLPRPRDRFFQREAARTLRTVAQNGSQVMYTGAWGQAFVEAVQREGGKVTLDDLQRYAPVWQESLSTEFAGHTVHAPGPGTQGGFDLLEALNLIEELKVNEMKPYWRDPPAFVGLSRALEFAQMDGFPAPYLRNLARARGIILEPGERATKSYARAALPLLDRLFNSPPRPPSSDHSDSIVVIDEQGNVASLVHTINTVLWGTTGIVVDGIPLSDAACFQQGRLAVLKAGELVPSHMAPVIVTKDGKPTLAIAAIGAALHPETARLLLGLLGNRLDASEVMSAPPLLLNASFAKRGMIQVPEGSYDETFLASLRAAGLTPHPRTRQDVGSIKGSAVLGIIDPATGIRRSVEVPRIFGFASGY